MDFCLSDSSIRTSDSDVFVRTTEAAHHMTLKMSKRKEGIIV